MPMRNLNDMAQHDGTQQKLSFGGPYHLYISLNGETLYRGEVSKSHDLYVAFEPLGDTTNRDEADR